MARTMSQQFGLQVEAATAPYQYALSTRAGNERVAHLMLGLCELNPDSTVMSIDGISACDQTSRAAMLDVGVGALHFKVKAASRGPSDVFVVLVGSTWRIGGNSRGTCGETSSRALTTSGVPCNGTCSPALEFVSTVVRRRSGTGAEFDQPVAMRRSGLHRQRTREPACGGDLVRPIYHRPSRELWCWAHLWESGVHPSASGQEGC